MSLSGYVPETRTISWKRGERQNSIEVRGLALVDLSVLIREHLPDVDAVFELFKDFKNLTPDQFSGLVVWITSNLPGLAANIIALASDEPTQARKAMKLPVDIQIQILMDVSELSMTEVGGVGKLMEMITSLLKKGSIERLKKSANVSESQQSEKLMAESR